MTKNSENNPFGSPKTTSHELEERSTSNWDVLTWVLPVLVVLDFGIGILGAETIGFGAYLIVYIAFYLWLIGLGITVVCVGKTLSGKQGSWHIAVGILANLLLVLGFLRFIA